PMDDKPQYSYYPLAQAFPLMAGAEYEQFRESIRKHGLVDPIVLFEGKWIVDGRNRDRACTELDVRKKHVDVDKLGWQGDLINFVLSKNLHRRHMNESQRALAAARIRRLCEQFNRDGAAAILNVSSRLVGHAARVL